MTDLVADLHPFCDIPTAPEPYIAHPFTLLRTRTGLIGRREELNLLTDWIARPETVGHARVFSLVAIGGQGKSALCWHWFNKIAPHELTGPRAVDGRVWWSFYESDATYENFVIPTLAYVTGHAANEVETHESAEVLQRNFCPKESVSRIVSALRIVSNLINDIEFGISFNNEP